MIEMKKPEEIAVARHQIISGVLTAREDGSDAAKITQLKKEACQNNGISRRTLERWLDSYSERGFEGLFPVPKKYHAPGAIPDTAISEAIFLRRELPSRSVSQIIEILEMEGAVPAGSVKRATLQEHLAKLGYSARQMKQYMQPGIAARRFARSERNDLWQADMKYGPHIKVNGERRQTYLVCFIDDATRYVVHAEFYDSQDQSVVEDCFRKAILKEGLPRQVYFDNGKQFKNTWMQRACAVLGIRLLFTKPYSPESKGKIERFNRSADAFLDEVSLKHCKTLDEYNKYFAVWLQECYHLRVHSGLKKSPEEAYKSAKTPLRFVTAETVAYAFRRVERRKVDKSGCISFQGKKYEVGVLFIGQTINISYDPGDPETLDAEPKYGESFRIRKQIVGPRTGPRPRLPGSMSGVTPTTSRLLDGMEKRYDEHRENARRAIRFGEFGGEGDSTDV